MNTLMHNSTATTAAADSRLVCERPRMANGSVDVSATYPSSGNAIAVGLGAVSSNLVRHACANPIFGGAKRDFWTFVPTTTHHSQRRKRS